MAYTKTIWEDKIIEKPKTFTIQDNVDGTITLIPVEGVVTQAGTPVNATNMNKIETILDGLGNVTAEIATQVEAIAGTSNVKYMTPLRVKEATDKIVFGVYTGDASVSRQITLGFRPKAVLLLNQAGQMGDWSGDSPGIRMYGGLALDGYPAGSGSNNTVVINATGFLVGYNATAKIITNATGEVYRYIAFK